MSAPLEPEIEAVCKDAYDRWHESTTIQEALRALALKVRDIERERAAKALEKARKDAYAKHREKVPRAVHLEVGGLACCHVSADVVELAVDGNAVTCGTCQRIARAATIRGGSDGD